MRSNIVLHKLVHSAAVALIATLLTAAMLDLTPGDPARAVLGAGASDEQVQLLRERLRLDDSFAERQLRWVGNAVQGDLGESFRSQKPVAEILWERLPITLEIAMLSLLIALVVAIPLGVIAGHSSGRRVGRFIDGSTSLMIALPAFVMAPLLTYVLVQRFDLLPAFGWKNLTDDPVDNLTHALLPALTLAFTEIPLLVRVLASDMSSTLREDYISNARTRGLSTRRILFGHALRPSSLSLVTVTGIILGRLIGGAVIVEIFFGLPGVGSAVVEAIVQKDLIVVQGIVLFMALAFIVVNTAIDIAYQFIDPRIRTHAA